MSRPKKTPLINLTGHQRDKLKATLDGLVLKAGIALAARQMQRLDELMARHDKITQALDDLGITIEGHEPAPKERIVDHGTPLFLKQEIAE